MNDKLLTFVKHRELDSIETIDDTILLVISRFKFITINQLEYLGLRSLRTLRKIIKRLEKAKLVHHNTFSVNQSHNYVYMITKIGAERIHKLTGEYPKFLPKELPGSIRHDLACREFVFLIMKQGKYKVDNTLFEVPYSYSPKSDKTGLLIDLVLNLNNDEYWVETDLGTESVAQLNVKLQRLLYVREHLIRKPDIVLFLPLGQNYGIIEEKTEKHEDYQVAKDKYDKYEQLAKALIFEPSDVSFIELVERIDPNDDMVSYILPLLELALKNKLSTKQDLKLALAYSTNELKQIMDRVSVFTRKRRYNSRRKQMIRAFFNLDVHYKQKAIMGEDILLVTDYDIEGYLDIYFGERQLFNKILPALALYRFLDIKSSINSLSDSISYSNEVVSYSDANTEISFDNIFYIGNKKIIFVDLYYNLSNIHRLLYLIANSDVINRSYTLILLVHSTYELTSLSKALKSANIASYFVLFDDASTYLHKDFESMDYSILRRL